MARSSFVPKRSQIQYKYAIGIAMKNYEPLLAREICDFIKVHMPSICTYKNNNWQNAVRSNLTTCKWFEKLEVRSETGKAQCFYKLAVGALEEFHEMFPFTYGSPYDHLTFPENHSKLYNGEMGYPKSEEIEAARISFEQEQQRWSKVYKDSNGKEPKNKKKEQNLKSVSQIMDPNVQENEMNEKKNLNYTWETEAYGSQHKYKMISSQKRFLGKDKENAQYYETVEVLAPVENQMMNYENFGQYDQSVPGPLRNQKPSTSATRMTPYQLPNSVFGEHPMPQFEPNTQFYQQSHNLFQQEQVYPNYLEQNYQLPPYSHNFVKQEENNTPISYENHNVFESSIPQIDYDFDLLNNFFETPIVHPPQPWEPIPNSTPLQ